jgi:hypothetical protein
MYLDLFRLNQSVARKLLFLDLRPTAKDLPGQSEAGLRERRDLAEKQRCEPGGGVGA